MWNFLQNELFRIGYFNWWLVSAYVVLLGIFLFGILRPRRQTEWKSAGVAQAWIIALYAEMYGTPLTAYLVMGALGRSQQDAETHFNGHLWPVIFGANESQIVWAQFACTVIGQALIVVGAVMAIVGWRQIHSAVKAGVMARRGLYRYVRHPQYTGFFLFLLGSVINWPTLITVATLPVLWLVYLKLAKMEEQDAIETFGDQYRTYMSRTGRFVPWFGRIQFAQPTS